MVVASVLGRILIMAGGTGGHVYPALAIAQDLIGRGYEVQWLGTDAGLESRVVPEAGITLNIIRASGFRGKGFFAKLLALFSLVFATGQSFFVLMKFRPGCVIGMGGYVAAPGGIASWLTRRTLLIHEQNAVAGTTNRILAKFAKRVLVAYPSAFPRSVNVDQIGNPVRKEILEAAIDSSDLLHQGSLNVLILGGSLGAKAINGVMPELADNLEDKNIKFWHQTGPLHYAEVEKDYAGRGLDNVRLAAFIEDIAAAYRWADLVICRAGALTVSELTVMSKPAVLIPLPEAIDDHQTHNAQWMEGAGAAVLVTQVDFSVSRMTKLLSDYSTHPELLKSMARKSGQIGCADATQLAVAICEEVYCE